MENFIFLFSAEYDPLAKTDSSLLGDFIFMLNPDWIAKKQLDVNWIQSIIYINSRHLKEIRIL